MDSELKCNRLTCRKPLIDKAVVTTCSHIFCIECANELFNASRLCPACETSLTEPDDVVICSLQPTNDYKTSVLSGLSPSTILEICSRAISFWQYQIHQENTFQQAVIRNLNDKNAQLQKQLDNVVREANGEISLLNKKREEVERDLELERRKAREFQDAAREREKEYQKLKTQFDKLKHKALFGPTGTSGNENIHPGTSVGVRQNTFLESRSRIPMGNPSAPVSKDFTSVEANRLQGTPLVSRNGGIFMNNNQLAGSDWTHVGQLRSGHRQPFSNFGNPGPAESAHRSFSERSASTSEVEQMLTMQQQQPRNTVPSRAGPTGWQVPGSAQAGQRVFAPTTTKGFSGRFRPAR